MVSTRVVGAIVLLATGCGIDLPEEALIEGPRVLGIRVVPQDADEAAAPPAALVPGTAAQVQVLAVDELGLMDPSSVSAQWLACPLDVGAPAFSCIESALPLDPQTLAACPDDAESTAAFPEPCLLSDALEPAFIVPGFSQAQTGARLALTVVLAVGAQRDTSACTDALLRGDYDTPTGCLYTSYTLTIARPGADANRHPTSVAMTVHVGGDTVELAHRGTLEVSRGELLTLSYAPGVQDSQSYPVPVNNGADFETANEEPAAQWFRTAGAFIAAAPFGPPSNEIELRTDDTSTRVYAVVRDGRGGLAWWWGDITVP